MYGVRDTPADTSRITLTYIIHPDPDHPDPHTSNIKEILLLVQCYNPCAHA